jgi:sulfur relay (sulfurtransferase) DsrC/TusE family protein
MSNNDLALRKALDALREYYFEFKVTPEELSLLKRIKAQVEAILEDCADDPVVG